MGLGIYNCNFINHVGKINLLNVHTTLMVAESLNSRSLWGQQLILAEEKEKDATVSSKLLVRDRTRLKRPSGLTHKGKMRFCNALLWCGALLWMLSCVSRGLLLTWLQSYKYKWASTLLHILSNHLQLSEETNSATPIIHSTKRIGRQMSSQLTLPGRMK